MENDLKSTEMLTLPTEKLLVRFAVPAICTMLLSSLYNMVDRIFIGHGAGYLGLSAVTLCAPVMQLMNAVTLLIGMGGSALFSISIGKGNREESGRILSTAFAAQLVLGVLETAAGILFCGPLCRLAGATTLSEPYAVTYLRIIMFGAAAQCLGSGMVNFVRAEGNPRYAMTVSVSGTVLNCLLDLLFILGFHWGVAGAAIATVLSQVLVAVLVILYFTVSETSEFHLLLHCEKLRLFYVTQMLRLGFSSFMTQVVTCIMVLICMNQLAYYGALEGVGDDVAISAVGISTTIGGLLAMFGAGMQQAAGALIGANYGARQMQRVRSIFMDALISLFLLLLFFYILLMAFPGQIAGLFGDIQNREFTIYALRGYNLALPVMAFGVMGSSYFQSTGQPVKANILSLSRCVIFFIPLLLILPPFFGLRSVILCAPISDFCGNLISIAFVIPELRRLKNAPIISAVE